jgi:hypothetical protein
MDQDNVLPFDLPAVARKKVSVGFDGGQMSFHAGSQDKGPPRYRSDGSASNKM